MNTSATRPLVSIVIATYNRSQPLRHAIQSVIDSTITDWELLIVGDACTDDTAECVSAFADSRISYHNLPKRCGYQSGPNNHGVYLARGHYIAFLNHDDIYLRDHLETCLAELETSGADFVWTATAALTPRTPLTPAGQPYGFVLAGVPVKPEYSTTSFYLPSAWVFRHELATNIGPWRAPEQVYIYPSQEWLFRASRSGASLRFIPKVSVIHVIAGYRPGCYEQHVSVEHDWLTNWIKNNPGYRELILEEAALHADQLRRYNEIYPSLRTIWRVLVRRPLLALLNKLGIHPRAFYNTLTRNRADKQVLDHKRITGAK